MSSEDLEQIKKKIANWNEANNPFRQFLNRIGDKWSLLVIVLLSKKSKNRCRFSELKRDIPGISQRMLTTTLRKLEQDGLVKRYYFAEIPPRVEYELTDLGKSLKHAVRPLFDWIKENYEEVQNFREKYVNKSDSE